MVRSWPWDSQMDTKKIKLNDIIYQKDPSPKCSSTGVVRKSCFEKVQERNSRWSLSIVQVPNLHGNTIFLRCS